MAVLKDAKTVSAPFSNSMELVKVTYDFAEDGGSIADYDVIVASGSMIVGFLYAEVEAALTSSGAMVVDLGKGAGGTQLWSDQAVATLALDAVLGPDGVERFVELTDGEKIVMGVEAFAATAGKMHLVFQVFRRA